jgi:hypothetical protein
MATGNADLLPLGVRVRARNAEETSKLAGEKKVCGRKENLAAPGAVTQKPTRRLNPSHIFLPHSAPRQAIMAETATLLEGGTLGATLPTGGDALATLGADAPATAADGIATMDDLFGDDGGDAEGGATAGASGAAAAPSNVALEDLFGDGEEEAAEAAAGGAAGGGAGATAAGARAGATATATTTTTLLSPLAMGGAVRGARAGATRGDARAILRLPPPTRATVPTAGSGISAGVSLVRLPRMVGVAPTAWDPEH